MKAKKKPLETLTPEQALCGGAVSRHTLPWRPGRASRGIKVEDVSQLVDKLKNEAKVI